jgi:hypothetical protein
MCRLPRVLTLRVMQDRHPTTLDRLEARIDEQAARIDELFRLLEASQIADLPLAREKDAEPTRS